MCSSNYLWPILRSLARLSTIKCALPTIATHFEIETIIYHNLSNPLWVFLKDLSNIEWVKSYILPTENPAGNENMKRFARGGGANLLLNGGHRWQRTLPPSKVLSDQSWLELYLSGTSGYLQVLESTRGTWPYMRVKFKALFSTQSEQSRSE